MGCKARTKGEDQGPRRRGFVGGSTRQPEGMSEEDGEAGMEHNEQRCCRHLELSLGFLVTAVI